MPKILDTLDIINNLSNIYDSDRSFGILKDFERVIDEMGIYVYENWEDGELVEGPVIKRHWVGCSFMWPKKKMPDPAGAQRLLDYDCIIRYRDTHIVRARDIKKPDDIRPGTRKGKLDKIPVWVVEIKMPKKLIVDVYGGSVDYTQETEEPAPAAASGAGAAADPMAAAPADPMAGAAPADPTAGAI